MADAVWILLQRMPVLPPYRAPSTWGELRLAVKDTCNLQLDSILCRALFPVRDGRSHVMLVGFPIPETFGQFAAPHQVQWQAIELPALAYGICFRPGFRGNALGYWIQDRGEGFQNSASIKWLSTENWHRSQLSSRGHVHNELAAAKVAVLGAGAVGSVVAEMLVRAGVHDMKVVDKDSVSTGNLVRHTLGLRHVSSKKSDAIAARLNDSSPNVVATGLYGNFPDDLSTEAQQELRQCSLVIDCTGCDSVLRSLTAWKWSSAPVIASVSIGFQADRLYFMAGGVGVDYLATLVRAFGSELNNDRTALDQARLPAEAAGCWHSLFPARIDHVWALAALAVSEIESVLAGRENHVVAVLLTRTQNGIVRERRL